MVLPGVCTCAQTPEVWGLCVTYLFWVEFFWGELEFGVWGLGFKIEGLRFGGFKYCVWWSEFGFGCKGLVFRFSSFRSSV